MKALIVAHKLTVASGVSACLMQYYEELVKEYKVDFLLLDDEPCENVEIVKRNGKVYCLPEFSFVGAFKTVNALFKIFKNQYDVVHVNIPVPYGALVLWFAKAFRVPVRIYHSHNPINKNGGQKRSRFFFLHNSCINCANYHVACSQDAGRSTYGNDEFDVLVNRISIEKYKFNLASREKIREQLGIENDAILIGCVARVDTQKNPKFLLQIVKELLKNNSKYFFVWVGDGPLLEEMIIYSEKLQIRDHCYFVGNQNNAHEWYSGFDLFLLPSLFEGLGIVYIEAQASGLRSFGSTNVPQDTEATDLMKRISLDNEPLEWAHIIDCVDRNIDRNFYSSIMETTDFNIMNNKNSLVQLYNRYYHDSGKEV